MTRTELLNSLIGKPWKPNALGPDAYDCWHLCQFIERELFARELPTIEVPPNPSWPWLIDTFKNHPERRNWVEVERWKLGKVINAQDGAVILMSRLDRPAHAGVWLSPENRVMHVDCQMGVCFEQLSMLHLGGWTKLIFFAPVNQEDQKVPLECQIGTN